MDQATGGERIGSLLAEQQRGWRDGARPLVESYLCRFPELRTDTDGVLDLICHEVVLREDAGETPHVDEYVGRFPDLATELRKQFEIHGVLASRAVISATFTARMRTSGPVVVAEPDEARDDIPERLGRFAIGRRLGVGGFGEVYLGEDTELGRAVAIKIAHKVSDPLGDPLAEARRMAQLEHPAIVSVYDLGRDDGRPYIVSQFIDGMSLAEKLSGGIPSLGESVELVGRIADALAYLHEQGWIHRDVKPANVLLDRQGRAYLTDLGLAVTLEDASLRHEVVGTPQYMSPEQLRSEDHRLDGRTDIYSLGVVLYEMLAGRTPFQSASIGGLFHAILSEEPRPVRSWNPDVPAELERVCLRAMARRAVDRFSTADALASELRAALSDAPAGAAAEATLRIVPRGLRPFGRVDSDFFPHLLPGPRRPGGVPETIHFWIRVVERVDEDALPVGLIYGPSGCGKTSILEAGLLPRLPREIVSVSIQASSCDTVALLTRALRRAAPTLRGESLPEMLRSLRNGDFEGAAEGRRFLLVVDQVEQWLQAHGEDLETAELTAALRQLDGKHCQALLLLRDDFWAGATRLFRALEVPMVEGRNVTMVDLFDQRHARRVLELLGTAHGALPARAQDRTPEHEAFVTQAVEQLAEDGKVVSVRLSLVAEMLKDRAWVSGTLDEIGGVAGVGLLFLERAFGQGSVPERRELESEARRVLETLLPGRGLDLKGECRTAEELAAAAGLDAIGARWSRLLEILERELYLISPAATGANDGDGTTAPPGYQLTHDSLVPALREWLTSKRRETWRGRARLALEERTAQWSRGREGRLLPTLAEYLLIAWGVRRSRRTPLEQKLMRSSFRRHASRWGVVLVACSALLCGFLAYRTAQEKDRALGRVEAAVSASAEALPYAVENLLPYSRWARGQLALRLEDPAAPQREKLRAACALAGLGLVRPHEIVAALPSAPTETAECINLVTALAGDVVEARGALWDAFRAADSLPLRVRFAALSLALGDARASSELLAPATDPLPRTDWIHTFPRWHGPLESYLPMFRAESSGALQSGLALALGRVEPGSVSDDVERNVVVALEGLLRGARDGGVRAAAEWALTRWRGTSEGESLAAPDDSQWFVNGVGMRLVRLLPGSFYLGSPNEEKPDSRRHRVTLTRSFYIADRELTVELYSQFLEDSEWPASEKPSGGTCNVSADLDISPRPTHPMQSVSWTGAVLFCNWLSAREHRKPCYRRARTRTDTFQQLNGSPWEESWDVWEWDLEADGYRLPTEAEWEYACRAGTNTTYFFGDDATKLTDYALSTNDVRRATYPVGTLMPNPWGLFDVHGNVWEWCWNWYHEFPSHAEVDPLGPLEPWSRVGPRRVHKGGGVSNSRGNPDAASRGLGPPEHCYRNVGFRVATSGAP